MTRFSPFIRLMRLDRPIGIWLLFWPGAWSITLAAQTPDLMLFYGMLFFGGAVVMRSAGCVINDIFDRDIDSRVARTRMRPLAAKEMSLRQAWSLLFILFIIGFIILAHLNPVTILIGCFFAVLVVLYPLMKRLMSMPQIFLGVTINAGALMGWSAVTGNISWISILVYGACLFWTFAYDTLYAQQDKKEDKQIGVGSAALVLAPYGKIPIVSGYCLAIALLLLPLIFDQAPPISFVFWGGGAVYLLYSLAGISLEDKAACQSAFIVNGYWGALIWLSFLFTREPSFFMQLLG